MIRTWFNTNTVLCHNFVLSGNALRLIVNREDQWSVTERLPYGAINLCGFFYCNRCKGLSGSISFPGQLSFNVLNRVLWESFFTRYNIWILLARYWHLSLSVCTINPTYRNLSTTSILWHFLLLGLLGARGVLTTVYDFCKTKTHKLLPWSLVSEGLILLFHQTFNFISIKEMERQCLSLRLSLLCLLRNSFQLSGQQQRPA